MLALFACVAKRHSAGGEGESTCAIHELGEAREKKLTRRFFRPPQNKPDFDPVHNFRRTHCGSKEPLPEPSELRQSNQRRCYQQQRPQSPPTLQPPLHLTMNWNLFPREGRSQKNTNHPHHPPRLGWRMSVLHRCKRRSNPIFAQPRPVR